MRGNNRPLHYWPMINLSPMHHKIHQSHQDCPHENNHTPVHRNRGDRNHWRKEREENTDGEITDGEQVYPDAPVTKAPGSPVDVFATKAFEDQKGDGDEIGGEEAGNGKGDDGSEGDS